MKNKTDLNIYKLGKMLGLENKDIVTILGDIPSNDEQSGILLGPNPYWTGGFYGSVSIKHFRNVNY